MATAGFMLRIALVLAIPALGGCFEGLSASESNHDSPDDGLEEEPNPDLGGGGAKLQCEVPSDCVLAASTCCECPTFAAPEGEGYDAGCDAVDCKEPSGLCPAVEATCDEGQCTMICSPVLVDRSCAFGFERDAAGCLRSECVGTPPTGPECELDTECVQIPADCCGCATGGEDRAVPESDAGLAQDELGCPSNPSCPGIDVCDASQVPRCITGVCVLSDEPMNPSMEEPSILLCGTPELGTCADGFNCLLNADSAKKANDLGVGSCLPE